MSEVAHSAVHDSHHECIGIFLPETQKKLVTFSTQLEMPGNVQTTDKPVVCQMAPKQILTDPDSEEARKKFEELQTD